MIGFKESKDSALAIIHSSVKFAAKEACLNQKGSPLNEGLAEIIAAAVTAGIEELVRQQYTDQDFENDVLK